MEKPTFKKLCFMYLQQLTNFPYIEKDFDAITDYQLLCKIVDYLNEVISNNNKQNEVITSLYNAFVEIKDYVDNYFKNLDVQEEVDNKLDEMAASGELADIIAQYLRVASVLGYDTKASLKSADNLVNGSITRTLGESTYNDGKGSYYKIRTVTSSDVIDDNNILALANYPTLIAEKIIDYYLNSVYDNLSNSINLINGNDTIFLGDSYAAGTTFESGSVQYLTSWCEYLRQIMGLTTGHYYIYAQGNAGFAKIGNNSMNFQMTLSSHLNDITDKNSIKNIIVCAGYNDWDQETSLIYQRIGEFISFCKTNFPNAQVYLGMIGGDSRDSSAGRQAREQLITRVLNAYNRCADFGGVYLTGVENFTHNFYQFNEQGNHPNEAGYRYVASMIYNAWKNGSCTMYEPLSSVSLTSNFKSTLNMQSIINNDVKTLFVDDFFADNINLSNITDTIELVPANTNNKVVKCTIDGKLQIPVDIYIYTGSAEKHAPGEIEVHQDGSIKLRSTLFAFEHYVQNLVVWATTSTHSILMS